MVHGGVVHSVNQYAHVRSFLQIHIGFIEITQAVIARFNSFDPESQALWMIFYLRFADVLL